MSRGRGYTIAEIDCLLDIIEDILPIGPIDWDRVTQRHIAYYPGHGRTRETLKRKFATLYNHKKPTGDPTCPPHVRNAKRIWDLIKLEMDVSDGEGGGDTAGDDNPGEEIPDDVPALPPMEDVDHDPPNEDGEDTTESSMGVGGGGGNVRGGGNVVPSEGSIAGVRVRTPRSNRTAGTPSQSTNFSELMQFMLMRADNEQRMEQRRRQEREEIEERRRREREEIEERNRRERQETEERRERRLERQLQNQSEMMQMLMMSMLGGNKKRKKDSDEEDDMDERN
jgi:hypothetical protein